MLQIEDEKHISEARRVVIRAIESKVIASETSSKDLWKDDNQQVLVEGEVFPCVDFYFNDDDKIEVWGYGIYLLAFLVQENEKWKESLKNENFKVYPLYQAGGSEYDAESQSYLNLLERLYPHLYLPKAKAHATGNSFFELFETLHDHGREPEFYIGALKLPTK